MIKKEKVSTYIINNIGTEYVCPICYENLNLNDSMICTECNHIFHYKCIKLAIERNIIKCPLCRRSLRNIDINNNDNINNNYYRINYRNNYDNQRNIYNYNNININNNNNRNDNNRREVNNNKNFLEYSIIIIKIVLSKLFYFLKLLFIILLYILKVFYLIQILVIFMIIAEIIVEKGIIYLIIETKKEIIYLIMELINKFFENIKLLFLSFSLLYLFSSIKDELLSRVW